jgi:formylglycine-generating enzyme required for sulfatase activity
MYLGWLGDPRPGVCTLPPAMVRIEGGEFVMGVLPEEEENVLFDMQQQILKSAGNQDQTAEDAYRVAMYHINTQRNTQSTTVTSFELARYPVTNAQYKFFMDDSGYNPNAPWWDEAGQTWLLRDDHAIDGLQQGRDHKEHPEYWYSKQFGIACPNHPVVGISWYEAMAFCRWLTQHQHYNPEGYWYTLPSEAEWEYAARRITRRTYPWGDDVPDAERANFGYIYKSTNPVGCFVAGKTPEEGIHDLAGNVQQWLSTIWMSYPYNANDGREHVFSPESRVSRGGDWINISLFSRASTRSGEPPETHDINQGFRLVRYPPDKT